MALMRFVVSDHITLSDNLILNIVQHLVFNVALLPKTEDCDPEISMIGSIDGKDPIFELRYFKMSRILIPEEKEDWPSNSSELLTYSGIITLEIFEHLPAVYLGEIYQIVLDFSNRYSLLLLTDDIVSPLPAQYSFEKYFLRG